MSTVERKAKAAALKQINKDRAAHNLPPLKSITRLWWSLYGAEWITRQPCPVCGDRACETKSEECGK